jgi:beta-lactamase regulating signal transducer with metallopeptidase domain
MTPADLLLAALLRAEAAGTVAILLVLVLRAPARRLIGAGLAYRLWTVVPVAAVTAVFPSLSDFSHSTGDAQVSLTAPGLLPAPLLLAWLAGAALTAAAMAIAEARFRRLARQGRAGPAVMGLFWPRMVVPADYDRRFTAPERDLIRAHERAHIARGDPGANLFVAAMRALNWFNPLVHLGAACARLDQELACDAAVVEARPDSRRLYGETLLKAHMTAPRSPFACAWGAVARHPLETRLSLLARPALTLSVYLRGAALVGLVALLAVLSVWGAGPGWSPDQEYGAAAAAFSDP